jgi:hypothetical protein
MISHHFRSAAWVQWYVLAVNKAAEQTFADRNRAVEAHPAPDDQGFRSLVLRTIPSPIWPSSAPSVPHLAPPIGLKFRAVSIESDTAVVAWMMTSSGPEELPTLQDFLRRPAWMDLAACTGQPVDLFLPHRGVRPATMARVKAICSTCQVPGPVSRLRPGARTQGRMGRDLGAREATAGAGGVGQILSTDLSTSRCNRGPQTAKQGHR